MELPFVDRHEAGRELAARLQRYAGRDDVVVMALPRGGVPVAVEVAARLAAPLDLMVVRKLGVPGHEELAMGAVAMGGVRVLNPGVVRGLGVTGDAIDRVTAREQRELERREREFRGDRPFPAIENRRVVVVDDGLATGSTMRAAVQVCRHHSPMEIVVAVPVAPIEAVEDLRRLADSVVVCATPEPFFAVGQWYQHFEQLTDADVRDELARFWHEREQKPGKSA